MSDEDVDDNAAREVEEELGIPYSSHNKPCYLFKFPYSDASTSTWNYVYYHLWNGPVKPQESEIDALFFWQEDKINNMIKQGAKITPDGLEAYNRFVPHWHKILRKTPNNS